jgi:hypothetical protein
MNLILFFGNNYEQNILKKLLFFQFLFYCQKETASLLMDFCCSFPYVQDRNTVYLLLLDAPEHVVSTL